MPQIQKKKLAKPHMTMKRSVKDTDLQLHVRAADYNNVLRFGLWQSLGGNTRSVGHDVIVAPQHEHDAIPDMLEIPFHAGQILFQELWNIGFRPKGWVESAPEGGDALEALDQMIQTINDQIKDLHEHFNARYRSATPDQEGDGRENPRSGSDNPA